MTALLFLTLVLSQVATDLQRIVDDAVVLDQYGYASQSTVVHFPKGHYYLDEPLVYRGQPHTQLTLRGVGIGTVLHYRGGGDYAIRFEGANKCSIESLRIINEATKPLKQVVWWDAVNADAGAPKYSVGSSGCKMSDVWILSLKKSLDKDGCLIRIAHDSPVTNQVSSMVFDRLLLDGPGHGTAVKIEGGGNVKCFIFNTVGITHLDYGFYWQPASGPLVINDLSAGNLTKAVVHQVGAGNLIGTAWNCEDCGPMIWQAGGNSAQFATITGFEWSNYIDKKALFVRSHGATKLEAGWIAHRDATPWVEMAYPLASSTAPSSLTLDRVWFNSGDGDRFPIRDGSGNKILDPAGWYKDEPVSFTAENCFIGGKKVEKIGK